MITLQRPDLKVSALLGEKKGVSHGGPVRPSQFAMPLKLGKRRVIFNTLTRQCIESKYFDWFEKRDEKIFDAEDSEMAALLKRDFIVAPGLNEAERYAKLINLIRRMEKQKPGYTGYTILPTTACNARCVYCYEEGIPQIGMSDETVEQTIRYIHATRREDSAISLHWFGGEPLVGEKIIDRICRAMRDAGVEYTSNMISNGSLMTEELAKKAYEDWKLKSIQITLDGREEVYCERKRYIAFDGSPYTAVLKGIHAMLDRGIRVSIRLNVDEENVEELMKLADDLEEEFRDDSLVSIYSHGIFADDDDDRKRDSTALYEEMEKLNERLFKFNQNRLRNRKDNEEISQEPVEDANIEWQTDEDRCPEDEELKEQKKRKYYDRRSSLRRYFCMVDSPMAGPVITPSGDMHLCEHIVDLPVVGNIYDETFVDKERFVERGREKTEKCRGCSLLPACMDFTSCPTESRDCKKEVSSMEKRSLRGLEVEEKLPPINIHADGRIVRITEPTAEFAEKCTPVLADDYIKIDETLSFLDSPDFAQSV